MEAALYDLIYRALAGSRVYRKAISVTAKGLPDWVIPLSHVDAGDLARVAAAMDLRPGRRFVDLACGLGGAGLWLAKLTGARVTGVDYSTAAVEAARTIAREQGLSGVSEFVVSDGTSTGLPDAFFDALVCIDAFQFMPPDAATAEAARILRSGGRAVITTWECVVDDLPLPTMVADYTPYFCAAGLDVIEHAVVTDAREREMRYFNELLAHADRLREEIGAAAEPILHEASDRIARAHLPPRVRKVLIVAQARS